MKENKKLKSIGKKVIGRFHALGLVMVCDIYSMARTVQAADKKDDVSEVTDGINILETLTLSLVQGVGVVFLSWGILDFATAYSAHDTSQQSIAIKKVIGGIVAIAAPAIIKLFT